MSGNPADPSTVSSPAADGALQPTPGRDMAIDAARGIAITLVVLTHATLRSLGQPAAEHLLWYQAIVAFDMPLFMFVAGYLLFRPKPLRLGSLTRSRAASLLVPYLVWMAINCATDALASPAVAAQRLAQGLVDPRIGGPWFLYVLFECVVVFALLTKVTRSSWWLIGSTLVIAGALTLVGPRDGTLLGKSDVQFLLPFVAFGFAYAKTRRSWRVADWTLAAGSLALFVGLCALTLIPSADAAWRLALAQSGLPGVVGEAASRLLRWATGLSGVVGVFAAAQLLRGWFARVPAVLGVTSLGIYVLHSTFLVLALGVPGMPMPIAVVGTLGLSVGAVLVLERWAPTRVLLLGIRAPRFTGGGPWKDRSGLG